MAKSLPSRGSGHPLSRARECNGIRAFLYATVDGWLQMAQGPLGKVTGWAYSLVAFSGSVEHGTTVQGPRSVLRYDTTITGRIFQNSGR